MLRCWLLALSALFCVSFSTAQVKNKAAVYVVAHPDDWQLFMGDDAYADIQDTTNRVVFILLTSGDATGKRLKPNLHFARSREKGALNSVRFSADMKTVVDSTCQTRGVTIRDHKLLCYPYKHVRTYFLRLPDGCYNVGYGGQSLQYLHDGHIERMTTLDSSATYESWSDLVLTLKAIIEKETAGYGSVALNYQDPDVQLNVQDNPDHIFSGLAAAQAGALLPAVQHTAYLGYCTANKPVNISPEAIAIKAGLFALADFGITEQGDVSAFNKTHLAFATRTYSRTLPAVDTSGLKRTVSRITTAPNPVTGSSVQVSYSLQAEERVQLVLTDITGTTLWMARDVLSVPGDNHYTVPVISTPGTYFLTLQTSAGTEQVTLLRL